MEVFFPEGLMHMDRLKGNRNLETQNCCFCREYSRH